MFVRDGYREDVKICEEIGGLLRNRVSSNGLNKKDLGNKYSKLIQLSEGHSIREIGSYLSRGPRPSQISPESKCRVEHIERNLEKLAIFYNLIGVEEDSEEVRLTREVNGNFIYID